MAVEIRELVIKAIITNDEKPEQDINSQPAVSTNNEQIIQECVSQVLKIIKQGQKR
jgi:hypothetical protein